MPTLSQARESVIKRPPVSDVQHHRARVAYLSRRDRGTDAELIEARRDLAMSKIEAYAAKVVASAPPLTDEQRERLAGLLNGAA